MVGAVIITHGGLAEAILDTADRIAGNVKDVRAIGIKGAESSEEIRAMLTDAIKEISHGDGVVIFTDMFGGTPSNIALSLLEEGEVEIITGVNLPLILKFLNNREGRSLEELVRLLVDHGHKSIVLASEMLKKKG